MLLFYFIRVLGFGWHRTAPTQHSWDSCPCLPVYCPLNAATPFPGLILDLLLNISPAMRPSSRCCLNWICDFFLWLPCNEVLKHLFENTPLVDAYRLASMETLSWPLSAVPPPGVWHKGGGGWWLGFSSAFFLKRIKFSTLCCYLFIYWRGIFLYYSKFFEQILISNLCDSKVLLNREKVNLTDKHAA